MFVPQARAAILSEPVHTHMRPVVHWLPSRGSNPRFSMIRTSPCVHCSTVLSAQPPPSSQLSPPSIMQVHLHLNKAAVTAAAQAAPATSASPGLSELLCTDSHTPLTVIAGTIATATPVKVEAKAEEPLPALPASSAAAVPAPSAVLSAGPFVAEARYAIVPESHIQGVNSSAGSWYCVTCGRWVGVFTKTYIYRISHCLFRH